MASCIVCNNFHLSDSKSLDAVVDHDQTLRLRLEIVLDEPVSQNGWMCYSCQFDLRQIETYYNLVNVFKQRYKDTAAQQWKWDADIKEEDSRKSQLQSQTIFNLGISDLPKQAIWDKEIKFETSPGGNQAEVRQVENATNSDFTELREPNTTGTEYDGIDYKGKEIDDLVIEDPGFDENDEPKVEDAEFNNYNELNLEEPDRHSLQQERYYPEPIIPSITSWKREKRGRKPQYVSCPICDKRVKGTAGLKWHMKVHAKKEPELPSLITLGPHDGLEEQNASSAKSDTGLDDIGKHEFRDQILMPNKGTDTSNKHVKYIKKYPNVQDGSYECPNCNRIFRKPLGLSIHMRVHDTKKTKHSTAIKKQKHSTTTIDVDSSLTERRRSKRFIPDTFKTDSLKNQQIENMETDDNEDIESEYSETESESENTFKCTKCERSFKRDIGLWRHMRAHIRQENPAAKKHHMEEDSDTSYQPESGDETKKNPKKPTKRKFACTQCDKAYVLKATLKRHMVTHTGQWPLMCSVCYKGFTDYCHLKMHMVSHSDERPYSCEHCGKAFKFLRDMKIHARMHTGDTLSCIVCEKKFVKNSVLARHMNSSHTVHTILPCPNCSKSFNSTSSLTAHMRHHMGDKKPVKMKHPCWKCGMTFSKATLKYHMIKHTGEKKHPCHVCNKRFYALKSVQLHMMVHQIERPFQCNQCGLTFKTEVAVQNHKLVHTDVYAFQCSVCRKAVRTRGSLICHMRTHTNVRPYTCTICSRTFCKQDNMKTHMKIHSNEKKFLCSFCDIAFRQKKTLDRHLRKHTERPDIIPRTRTIHPSNAYNIARQHNLQSEIVQQPEQQDARTLEPPLASDSMPEIPVPMVEHEEQSLSVVEVQNVSVPSLTGASILPIPGYDINDACASK